MFSCEFDENFKNTYFEEHLWNATSVQLRINYPLNDSEKVWDGKEGRNFFESLCFVKKQPPEVFFLRKGVIRNFATFTEKHLCQSLLVNKVAALISQNSQENTSQFY